MLQFVSLFWHLSKLVKNGPFCCKNSPSFWLFGIVFTLHSVSPEWQKGVLLALFSLKMIHFVSFFWHFLKLFFGTLFYLVFDRLRACSCQKRVCFHGGRFIRKYLCVFVVFCVNLLCVDVGGGRRSARAFGVWPPFPPPHLTLSHTGLLVNAQRSVSKLLTGQNVKPAASRPAGPKR